MLALRWRQNGQAINGPVRVCGDTLHQCAKMGHHSSDSGRSEKIRGVLQPALSFWSVFSSLADVQGQVEWRGQVINKIRADLQTVQLNRPCRLALPGKHYLKERCPPRQAGGV